MSGSSPARAGAALGTAALFGAGFGLLGGLVELAAVRLEAWVRIPYVLGADGLLGAALGGLAALLTLALPPVRRRGLRAVLGVVFGLVLFPGFAAALGILVNKVLLRGEHFLSRTSLLADAAAIVVAGILAILVARGAARLLPDPFPAPSRRTTLGFLAVLAALFLLPGTFRGRGAPDPDRPTVVVVSIDTLRPDRLSTGGWPQPTSPEIDRLCREGRQYVEAVAASPGSAASHAALLTGRYPVSNGVWSNFTVMDRRNTTLAEILQADGYRTGGFATNTFLGRRFHFDQGFDAYVESGQVERLGEPSRSVLWRSLALVQIVDRIRVRLTPGYEPSFETALHWIRETNGPALFFVHLMDVHSPYVPPHPWGPRFGATPSGGQPESARRNRFGWRPSPEAYTAEVAFADDKIGRLRRTLQECGRLDECVLVLTSDHGENLLDHEPNFSHGQTLFDATLRILAAIRAPQTELEPGLEPTLLENVDLLPTLADLLVRVPHDEWEGRSFHPRAPQRTRPAFCQLNRDFAVRTHEAKLVARDDGGRDYYRLLEDPGETRSAVLDPSERQRLEGDLARWQAEYATELYEGALSVDPDDLTPELREKLRALGYVD